MDPQLSTPSRAGPPARRPAGLPDPESLHPALWRAYQLARSGQRVLASGYPELDQQLPGGGWPLGGVTELLLPHPGVGEIRLLAPCLAEVLQAGRLVMLFDPPACLSAWALAALGIEPESLLVVYTRRAPEQPLPPGSLRGAHSHVQAGGDSLWALEQALQSGHVGAVLAWLPPRLRPERLRRLQFSAQAHDGPAFLFREWAALEQASPAPLRLCLRAAGVDRLAVRLLKRRGPWHAQALNLALPPVLPADLDEALAEEGVDALGDAGFGMSGPLSF